MLNRTFSEHQNTVNGKKVFYQELFNERSICGENPAVKIPL